MTIHTTNSVAHHRTRRHLAPAMQVKQSAFNVVRHVARRWCATTHVSQSAAGLPEAAQIMNGVLPSPSERINHYIEFDDSEREEKWSNGNKFKLPMQFLDSCNDDLNQIVTVLDSYKLNTQLQVIKNDSSITSIDGALAFLNVKTDDKTIVAEFLADSIPALAGADEYALDVEAQGKAQVGENWTAVKQTLKDIANLHIKATHSVEAELPKEYGVAPSSLSMQEPDEDGAMRFSSLEANFNDARRFAQTVAPIPRTRLSPKLESTAPENLKDVARLLDENASFTPEDRAEAFEYYKQVLDESDPDLSGLGREGMNLAAPWSQDFRAYDHRLNAPAPLTAEQRFAQSMDTQLAMKPQANSDSAAAPTTFEEQLSAAVDSLELDPSADLQTSLQKISQLMSELGLGDGELEGGLPDDLQARLVDAHKMFAPVAGVLDEAGIEGVNRAALTLTAEDVLQALDRPLDTVIEAAHVQELQSLLQLAPEDMPSLEELRTAQEAGRAERDLWRSTVSSIKASATSQLKPVAEETAAQSVASDSSEAAGSK